MPDPAAIARADEASRSEASGLPQPVRPDFLRLTKSLLHGPSFQWMLAEAHDDRLRERLIDAIDRVLRVARMDSSRLPLGPELQDAADLEDALIRHAKGSAAVHVIGRRDWFDSKRWDGFNVRRERLASRARARLIFWLDAEGIASAADGAPDLWSWRSGIYTFEDPASAPAPAFTREAAPSPSAPLDTRSATERQARIAEIRRWLDAHPNASADDRVIPYDELGRLLYSLGEYDAAERHWREQELPLHRERGDDRAVAITLGRIADVLQARGQLDEALRIRREDLRPTFERLSDVRGRAFTLGKIADVLKARGQIDEALLSLREEVLPSFEHSGDERSRAVTMGKIADILLARGQLDEALRIRRADELPAFERLGDAHARAVTMGKIADIHEARGQLDEALLILRTEVLPTFERLGDVRWRAVTIGNIADILRARGQVDEALRILQEEVRPAFERLGDVQLRALAMGRIADILQARGQVDEASRIRREEELPVYERLGDVRELAVVRWKIAQQASDRGEAERLFREALSGLRQLGSPHAQALEAEMRSRGIDPGDALM